MKVQEALLPVKTSPGPAWVGPRPWRSGGLSWPQARNWAPASRDSWTRVRQEHPAYVGQMRMANASLSRHV